jgi:hypothetical protein
MDKNDYYHSFKTQLEGWLRVESRSRVTRPLTQVYMMIKMIIIIILKFDLEVDSGKNLGHGLG